MDASDLELVRAAAAGEQSAFHTLVDRHAKSLFRLALSLSGSRDDAEDLCQETLVGAFQGLARFDGRAAVKTWLTRILIHRASKLWRKRRLTRGTISIDANVDDSSSSSALTPSVASTVNSVENRIDLSQILQTLDLDHRQVIVLRELEGQSYEEIAQTLGIPRGTVESRLHRARNELRQRLKGYHA